MCDNVFTVKLQYQVQDTFPWGQYKYILSYHSVRVCPCQGVGITLLLGAMSQKKKKKVTTTVSIVPLCC